MALPKPHGGRQGRRGGVWGRCEELAVYNSLRDILLENVFSFQNNNKLYIFYSGKYMPEVRDVLIKVLTKGRA